MATEPSLGGLQLWADLWIRSGWRVQRRVGSGACRLLDPRDRILARGSEAECRAAGLRLAPRPRAGAEAVILLHGMGRTRRMMGRMEAALEAAGHVVANLGYPSLRAGFADHVAQVASVAAGLAADGATVVHVAGHNLGGLVGRAAMAAPIGGGARWGRLVTLGTPHRGAGIADMLSPFAGYRALCGESGQVVTTRAAALLPLPEGVAIGAIAGGTGGARGMNPLIAGDNDLVVRVAEARPPRGEADFLLIRHGAHSFLPSRREAIAATLCFIASGRLRPGAGAARPAEAAGQGAA